MTTRTRKLYLVVSILVFLLCAGCVGLAFAADAPGTVASTATATYKDAAGNAYAAASNTVLTGVADAKSSSSYCLSCKQTNLPQSVNYYNFAQSDNSFAVGNTGFAPLDSAVTMISKFFMINVLRTNPAVQVGFIRFMLFIVLFTIFRFGLGKVFDSSDANQAKNVNIIGFVIALIGTIFMKDQWVLANGGVMAAIAGLLVPLLVAIPALVYAFKKENGEGAARNWMGVAILFGALVLIMLYMNITGFATTMGVFLLIPAKAAKRLLRGER